MTQATDPNDADPGGRVHAVIAERVVNGNTTAEQRRGALAFQICRDRHDEAGIDTNCVGVASVAVDACTLDFCTEVLEALAAPFAVAAGTALPADADPVADSKTDDLASSLGDGAYNLMAGNEWILANAPVVVYEVEVAVADAAVRDPNLDITWLEFATVIFIGQQFGASRMRRESVYHSHP